MTTNITTTKINVTNTASILSIKHELSKFLQSCIDLGRLTNQLLTSEENNPDKNEVLCLVQRLEFEFDKVNKLELRMPIIAPMKAGKSTIINAILGQELLPTRNTAMTVIPTEIVLNNINTQQSDDTPYLYLDTKFIDEITRLQSSIQDHLKNDSDALQNISSSYPHLLEIVQQLQNTPASYPILTTKTYGAGQICRILAFINDIIRIHEILIGNKNSRNSIEKFSILPRIYASYSIIGNESFIYDSLGNLVIVDTPGPNEATNSTLLKEICFHELEKAGIILVVVDFTSLNTEVDHLVAQEINLIRTIQHSNDSLYALVNKVDQRDRRSLTEEQVKELVITKFGIGTVYENRVFEIQARRALLSKQFRLELLSSNSSDIKNLPSANDFIIEAFGVRGKKKMPTIEEIHDAIEYLWEESGFPSFLHDAIECLITKAAPRCLAAALAYGRSANERLRENVQIRRQLLDQDADKLNQEIINLSEDLEKLNEVMKIQRTILEQMKQNQILDDMEATFDEAKTNGIQKLQMRFDDLKKKHTNRSLVLIAATHAKNALSIKESDTKSFKNLIFQDIFLWLLEKMTTTNDLQFDNEFEAKNTIKSIETLVHDISREVLHTISETINNKCEHFREKLNTDLKSATEEVLIKAQDRLRNTFNLIISSHRFIEEVPSHVQTITDAHRIERTYRPWWTLWLVDIPFDDNNTGGETKYRIRLDSLKSHCYRIFRDNIRAVKAQVHEYLGNQLQTRFENHFNELEKYLKRYRNFIFQSLKMTYETIEEQENFKLILDKLLIDYDENYKRINILSQQLSHIQDELSFMDCE
jgi:GTPase Era involved in 16S rRNA processing